VLEYIITTPDVFDRFAYYNAQGVIVWKPGACHATMKKIYNLQMKLFIGILLSAGEPGRASELTSHIFRNVSGGSIRNVLVMFNIFTLRGTFNKTSHASHSDKSMVRIPLMQLGRQCIRFLVYLRPVFEEWQHEFRPHMHFNARHFLFAGLDHPVRPIDLSKAVARFTHKVFDIKLTLGQYRQFMAFITSCNQPLFESAQVTTSATDDQFGHTGQMHSGHYNGNANLPTGLDSGVYFKTARTSAAMQMLFGHPPDLMIALSKGNEYRNFLIDTIVSIRRGHYNNDNHPPIGASSSAMTTEALLDAIKRNLMPDLFLHGTRALSSAFAAVVDLFAPYHIFPRTNVLQPVARTLAHPYLLKQLRRFRGALGTSVGFFNATQGEATALMYAGKEHFAYISETGMLFLFIYLFFVF
jgi:hypothetical protein